MDINQKNQFNCPESAEDEMHSALGRLTTSLLAVILRLMIRTAIFVRLLTMKEPQGRGLYEEIIRTTDHNSLEVRSKRVIDACHQRDHLTRGDTLLCHLVLLNDPSAASYQLALCANCSEVNRPCLQVMNFYFENKKEYDRNKVLNHNSRRVIIAS
ncbi:hypothetical protein PROFUN_11918 [Planoprotostelium fungivorum]|uniref:Uncharacterized protein n=1 Tax=Planoprotostelium fungivorum TaxID=1890364 RepID=A0A2P6N8S4_9EUKA|nr:hypothetical protein PROFUN_11918 [Planoprotostelium fungivorum]